MKNDNIVKIKGIENYPITFKEIKYLFKKYTMKELKVLSVESNVEIIYDNYLRLNFGNIYKGNTTRVIIDNKTFMEMTKRLSTKENLCNAVRNYIIRSLDSMVSIDRRKSYTKVVSLEVYSTYTDSFNICGDTKVTTVKGDSIIKEYKELKKDKKNNKIKLSGQGLLFTKIDYKDEKIYHILYKPVK